jgi:hypothetical protein
VQRAAAEITPDRGWHAVKVAVDPLRAETASPDLLQRIGKSLTRYRRAGHRVHVQTAEYVPLEIALKVEVWPGYLRRHVEAALGRVFSNRIAPDGSRGFFHPDNLSFGDDIYLSRLVAEAQTVAGVRSVHVTKLADKAGTRGGLPSGVLKIGRLEIARLDNDPDFSEFGELKLEMAGGR